MSENIRSGKKLYRSNSDKYIAGVAGGFGEYLNIDAMIIRILFVLFTIFGGMGLLVYIAALILVPQNPDSTPVLKKSDGEKNMFWAILFIAVGVLLLFRELDFFHYFYFWDIPWALIWAILFILAGVFIILFRSRSEKSVTADATSDAEETDTPSEKRLHKNSTGRMIGGVCAGIADYFKIDPSVVRILWAFFTIISGGALLLLYFILVLTLPEKA